MFDGSGTLRSVPMSRDPSRIESQPSRPEEPIRGRSRSGRSCCGRRVTATCNGPSSSRVLVHVTPEGGRMVVEIGSDVPRRDQRGFEYSSRSRRGMRMRMTVSASRRPTARTSGLVRRARAIAILLALVLSACTSAQGQDAGRSSATIGPDDASGASAPAAEPGWRLVAIGDSLAQATACDGCRDFVQLYVQAITDATGVPVDVDERTAVQFSNLPAVEATQLLNDLLTDQSLRNAIADADIILINVGFNDTPWNRLDNPCGASNYTATVIRWNEVTPAC